MRALVLALAALLPSLAQAGVLEFNFSGDVNPNGNTSGSFQGTFLANTSRGSSATYAFSGGCVGSLNANFSIFDFNLTVSGTPVMAGGKGTFDVSTPAGPDGGCSAFLGDVGVGFSAAANGKVFSVNGSFDAGVFGTQSAILASKDPLGLIFNNADFSGSPASTGPVGCSVPGFPPIAPSLPPSPYCDAFVSSTLVSATEPNLLGLFAAGGLGLLLFRRRRTNRPNRSLPMGPGRRRSATGVTTQSAAITCSAPDLRECSGRLGCVW
jgi:MYXO-CTERM domain-containing protein